jgi:CO/xanthine dehydrogenase FAD-binding subunit
LLGRSLTDDAIAAAAAGAMADSRPITDIRATGDYRRAMVEVFVRRALTGLRDGEAA